MEKFTVAVAQMCTVSNKQVNYEKAEALIAEAAQKGAQLVLLPEDMHYIGPYSPDNREDIPGGECCQRLSAAAKKHNIWVHAGTIKEISPHPYKAYNTALLFSPQGELVSTYRKMHLCDIVGGPGVTVRESDKKLAGDQLVTVQTELGCIGMATCYDIRFPEMLRLLAMKGAQILCIPACFLNITGSAHWEVLLRAAAIHNSCYILASDQCGTREDRTVNWGHAMIIDPWGTVIAQAGQEKEGLIFAEIDLAYSDELKARLGSFHNRRTDIYSLTER